jgi:hypothetical protein
MNLIDVHAAADLAQCHPQRIRIAVINGELMRRGRGRKHLFDPSDVERWVRRDDNRRRIR